MQSDDVLIRVEHLSKKFCRSLKHALWYGARDIGRELLGRNAHHGQLRPSEFWAVDDVDFEVRRGECLGLIGRNGAGKSTLLKMLNGLIKPDCGRVTIRGRVGGLIELGAGFTPILTGRENIYNNAAVLGISQRAVNIQLDAIIDFAEIGDAIDAPVQTYSSGMKVRLGFAVAAHLEPDVLLIDEVLAVGDIGFVVKCLNAVRKLSQRAAIVFVSHNMTLVSFFCTHVLVMHEGGKLVHTANLGEGIDTYLAQFPVDGNVAGTGEVVVEALRLEGISVGQTPDELRLRHGDTADLSLAVSIADSAKQAYAHVYIMDEAMTPLVCFPVQDAYGAPLLLDPGRYHLRLPLGKIDLNAGRYSFTVIILSKARHLVLARVQGLLPFRVVDFRAPWGKVVRPVAGILVDRVASP